MSDIPLGDCAKYFGQRYAESVVYGLSDPISLHERSQAQVASAVLRELHRADAERYTESPLDAAEKLRAVLTGITRRSLRVFALSYKHDIYGWQAGGAGGAATTQQAQGATRGPRQRMRDDKAVAVANGLAHLALRDNDGTGKAEHLVFWLDQILGQRRPYTERNWVREGLLPYAVFPVVVIDYDAHECGAWLTVERLLPGMGAISERVSHHGCTTLKPRQYWGGVTNLMWVASAILRGRIASLRGRAEDKREILAWAIHMLDMSEVHGRSGLDDPVTHFTRTVTSDPIIETRSLKAILLNIEIENAIEVWRNREECPVKPWHAGVAFLHASTSEFLADGVSSYTSEMAETVVLLLQGNKYYPRIRTEALRLFITIIPGSGRPAKILLQVGKLLATDEVLLLKFKVLQFDELHEQRGLIVLYPDKSINWGMTTYEWVEVRTSLEQLGYSLTFIERRFKGLARFVS